MQARVQKWGNSLALRIPKAFAEETGLEQDTPVEITIEGDHIIVRPIKENPYTLDELLAGITDDNLHGEVDTGDAVGNEAW